MREDILQSREEKVRILAQAGISAYPEKTNRDASIGDVIARFDDMCESAQTISVAGRIRSLRVMGNIAFVHIEDESGKIQVFFEKKSLGDSFGVIGKTIDIGDFIEVSGTLFATNREEKTVRVVSWTMLAKALRPIPSEYFGMSDSEELLRRRYLDLLLHEETREVFRKKNIFWQTIRSFLSERGFLEVQTPVLEHIPGGAEAEPFVTHYNALDEDLYLRISLELPLKRLLVGGYEKVFEIGRVFRNEGISREHLQEFDHIEFYQAYSHLDEGMRLSEDLFRAVAKAVLGGYTHQHNGETIDWEQPFLRVEYFEAFLRETGIDLSGDVSADDLKKKADELKITYESSYGKGRMIDTIYKKTVRPKLVQPAFLVGHPIEVSPLAKTDTSNPKKVLRAQIVAGGSELSNMFAELNDPKEQRRRFEEQSRLREAGDAEAQMLDEDFLQAMEYGMPPAFGFGMSERFFAFLMNRSIRETVPFPPVRVKK
jgi:lysyl-tRNA synthetase class 2